jgi:hypothetical protein
MGNGGEWWDFPKHALTIWELWFGLGAWESGRIKPRSCMIFKTYNNHCMGNKYQQHVPMFLPTNEPTAEPSEPSHLCAL